MFILAGVSLSRLISPQEPVSMGYGYYLILIVWLLFLIFKIALMALFYFSNNYATFVLGFGLSPEAAERFRALIEFFNSFYLLLSLSLIISISIGSIAFLVERMGEKGKSVFIRKGLRGVLTVLLLALFLFSQGRLYRPWAFNPHYTLSATSRTLGEILDSSARLAGPYAHPLTLENDLDKVYMTFFRPGQQPPCERCMKYKATHFIIDTKSGLGYVHEYYPETFECLEWIETFFVRGTAVELYAYTGAEEYDPTGYERARKLIAAGEFEEAEEILSQFIEEHPDAAPPLTSLALSRLRLNDLVGAEEALERALAIDPDYMMAHWGMGQVMEIKGDRIGALRHYYHALELNPRSERTREKIKILTIGNQ
jgi:tetratricopeptide (TPR) repeat protein